MFNKDVAASIRESALKHLATAADIAEKLMALADSLDPPREPAVAKPGRYLACDFCGLMITADPKFDGEICGGVGLDDSPCEGTFRTPRTMATARANSCTCDRCGDQILGLAWLGEMCQATVGPGRARVCLGVYRLDPEPDEELTTADGRSLGVTRDELAMQAVRDYVHGHGDKVHGLDMATTYRGRS